MMTAMLFVFGSRGTCSLSSASCAMALSAHPLFDRKHAIAPSIMVLHASFFSVVMSTLACLTRLQSHHPWFRDGNSMILPTLFNATPEFLVTRSESAKGIRSSALLCRICESRSIAVDVACRQFSRASLGRWRVVRLIRLPSQETDVPGWILRITGGRVSIVFSLRKNRCQTFAFAISLWSCSATSVSIGV